MYARSDGHSGIENGQVNQGGSGGFQLILSYLKQGDGQAEFVIHASSNYFNLSGLNPLEYLSGIGFTHYQGQCPFHRENCLYRTIATLDGDHYGFENHRQVQYIHDSFKRFAEKIGELFSLSLQQEKILREIGIDVSGKVIFGPPIEVKIDDSDVPIWVNQIKFARLLELESQRESVEGEIEDLNRFLPLVFGTGDLLENAVLKALTFMGLYAKKAQKGYTADILAETEDGTKRFGFEVTGISGHVKKDSSKLTQVLDFERIKEHEEKTVLVANTHNKTPSPSERV